MGRAEDRGGHAQPVEGQQGDQGVLGGGDVRPAIRTDDHAVVLMRYFAGNEPKPPGQPRGDSDRGTALRVRRVVIHGAGFARAWEGRGLGRWA